MKWRFGTAAIWLVVAVMAAALAMQVATPLAAQNRATRPQIDRPDGPPWQVIRKNCTSCHGIDDYAYYAMDKAGWKALILSKHQTGAGAGAANLSDPDWNSLLDWLGTKLGPDTKPFPRSYVAPEITEFFSDPEANRLLTRACTACHNLERVNVARNATDKWRVITLAMREKGAQISDEEVERLVEWLGRVKGINPNQ